LLRGLKETGYVEGQNVGIEYRWAENQADRLATLAADLVHRRVAVIVATTIPAALAAKAATATIPIVFSTGSDPFASGLVASLNRPGANLTGSAVLASELAPKPVAVGLVASFNRPGGNATGLINNLNLMGPKRLGLLHELVPDASVIGMLVNPTFPDVEAQLRDVREAAQKAGLQVQFTS
jgi:putative ABC transport system substrate-binding protein